MVDEMGQNVSLDADWRASIMANSPRDPYWKASVRKELLANPALEEEINSACTLCHAPMANTADRAAGTQPHLFDMGYLAPNNPQHAAALDGVSCALCHQVTDANLGTRAATAEVSSSIPTRLAASVRSMARMLWTRRR
jgi:hypothetical protein